MAESQLSLWFLPLTQKDRFVQSGGDVYLDKSGGYGRG